MKVGSPVSTKSVQQPKEKRGEMPNKLRGATYNAEIGRDPKKVAAFVSHQAHSQKLDFIQLQEISGYHKELNNIKGYHLVTFPKSKDHGETGILVRDGLDEKGAWSLQSKVGWTNVRGGVAQPRAATTVKIAGWLRLASVHAPPGINWKNGHPVGPAQRIKAYASVMNRLKTMVKNQEKRNPNTAVLIAGDWNEGHRTQGTFSPGQLAKQTGMKSQGPVGIDWTMVKGAKVTNEVKAASGGSDHRMVTFTVTRPGHHKKPAAGVQTPGTKPSIKK